MLLSALLALWTRTGFAQEGEDLDDEAEDEGLEQDALTAEQLRGLHQKLDLNGDGKVSLMETMEFAEEMRKQIAGKDIQTVMEEMDINKDGKLSLEELLKDMESWTDSAAEDDKQLLIKRQELEAAKFKLSDKDGDNLLDMEELPGLFYPETNEGVLHLTAKATLEQKDKDGDGKLTANEFWEGDLSEGEEMHLSEEELSDFKKLDKDGDGKLDLEELKAWESGRFHTEEAMKRLVELSDQDSDLHFTAHELEAAREQIAGSDAQYHLMEWAEHVEL